MKAPSRTIGASLDRSIVSDLATPWCGRMWIQCNSERMKHAVLNIEEESCEGVSLCPVSCGIDDGRGYVVEPASGMNNYCRGEV